MNIIMQRIDLAGENPVLSADAVPQEDGTVEALWTVEVKRSQSTSRALSPRSRPKAGTISPHRGELPIAVDLTDWEACAYVKAADGEEVEPIRGRVRGDRIAVPLSGLPAVLVTLALKLEKDGQKQTLAVLQLVPAAGGSLGNSPQCGEIVPGLAGDRGPTALDV